MSAFLLLQALREYLEPKLAQFPLAQRRRDSLPPKPEEPDPMRPCAIFIGSMPQTVNEAAMAAPFLVIQAMNGDSDSSGMDNFEVALRVCIVADDYESAENDLLNLLSQLRLWLSQAPGGVIGKRFRLLPDADSFLPWERPDDQHHPFLQAYILSRWQTHSAAMQPQPVMVDYE